MPRAFIRRGQPGITGVLPHQGNSVYAVPGSGPARPRMTGAELASSASLTVNFRFPMDQSVTSTAGFALAASFTTSPKTLGATLTWANEDTATLTLTGAADYKDWLELTYDDGAGSMASANGEPLRAGTIVVGNTLPNTNAPNVFFDPQAELTNQASPLIADPNGCWTPQYPANTSQLTANTLVQCRGTDEIRKMWLIDYASARRGYVTPNSYYTFSAHFGGTRGWAMKLNSSDLSLDANLDLADTYRFAFPSEAVSALVRAGPTIDTATLVLFNTQNRTPGALWDITQAPISLVLFTPTPNDENPATQQNDPTFSLGFTTELLGWEVASASTTTAVMASNTVTMYTNDFDTTATNLTKIFTQPTGTGQAMEILPRTRYRLHWPGFTVGPNDNNIDNMDDVLRISIATFYGGVRPGSTTFDFVTDEITYASGSNIQLACFASSDGQNASQNGLDYSAGRDREFIIGDASANPIWLEQLD